MNTPSRAACVAEAIGTFALVFAGTGAIVVNDFSGGAVTHVGVALTFGLVVMAMIYAVGDVSGAHLNPAVTIGFWLSRRFPGRSVAPYVASQLAGAFVASALLRVMFGTRAALGATSPAGPVPREAPAVPRDVLRARPRTGPGRRAARVRRVLAEMLLVNSICIGE